MDISKINRLLRDNAHNPDFGKVLRRKINGAIQAKIGFTVKVDKFWNKEGFLREKMFRRHFQGVK